MDSPKLLPTTAAAETFAGVSYHLDGELVPALTIDLTPSTSIFFEHHTLLWKHQGVEIGVKALGGVFKRMLASMPIIMTEARGTGQVAFSRAGVGHVFPIHLKNGSEVHVRENQFLAATGNIDFTFERVRGVSNILFGGSGFFIDKFIANKGDGIVWLHGYGNVFEIDLKPSESIDVNPGCWLYKSPNLRMGTNLTRLSTGLFAGQSFLMNRFTGPGRLGIQSMPSPFQPQVDAGAAVGGLGLIYLLGKFFKK